MAWHNCPKCGGERKIDQIATPDGFEQPECSHCGDPGYFEPFDKETEDE